MGRYQPARADGIETIFSNYTGLVNLVSEIERSHSDPGVFVVTTEVADTSGYNQNVLSSSGSGAGLTYKNAFYAALGEATERYCLSCIPEDELVWGSYETLSATLACLPPAAMPLFTDDLYQQAPLGLKPFTAATELTWVAADNLGRRQTQYLPANLVYLPYKRFSRKRKEDLITISVSTGTACAATATDACFKAVCELVERDAFMITWRNRIPAPEIRIDESSPLHPVVQRHFKRPGLEYRLFLTTLDLGMPSVFGILINHRLPHKGTVVGGAAHPDPQVAVLKTLLELVQGYHWMNYSQGNKLAFDGSFDRINSFEARMQLYSQNNLHEAFDFLGRDRKPVLLSEIKSTDKGSPAENLSACVHNIGNAGLEILAKDITTPDIGSCGLAVVRVVIPGIEMMEGDHRYPFLAGTRWKEVPEKLGYRLPGAPVEINPFPHPYP